MTQAPLRPSPRSRQTAARILALGLITAALGAVGCGDEYDYPDRVPVSGQVYVDPPMREAIWADHQALKATAAQLLLRSNTMACKSVEAEPEAEVEPETVPEIKPKTQPEPEEAGEGPASEEGEGINLAGVGDREKARALYEKAQRKATQAKQEAKRRRNAIWPSCYAMEMPSCTRAAAHLGIQAVIGFAFQGYPLPWNQKLLVALDAELELGRQYFTNATSVEDAIAARVEACQAEPMRSPLIRFLDKDLPASIDDAKAKREQRLAERRYGYYNRQPQTLQQATSLRDRLLGRPVSCQYLGNIYENLLRNAHQALLRSSNLQASQCEGMQRQGAIPNRIQMRWEQEEP